MRFNDATLQQTASARQCDREGRLLHKSPKESYRERWFRLKGNLLFYYKTNSKGAQSDNEAVGVMVLDECRIQMEPIADRPFVFSIWFNGESKPHYFSGQSLYHCQDWVSAFQAASMSDLRAQMCKLQERIQRMTGKDPLDDIVHIPHSSSRDKKVRVKTKANDNNKKDFASGRSSFAGSRSVPNINSSLVKPTRDIVSGVVPRSVGQQQSKINRPPVSSLPNLDVFQPNHFAKPEETSSDLVALPPPSSTRSDSQVTPEAGLPGANSYLHDLALLDPVPVKPQQVAYSIDRLGVSRLKTAKPPSPAPNTFSQAPFPGSLPQSSPDLLLLSPSKLMNWEKFE